MTRIIVYFITLAALCFVLILIFSKNQKPWNEMSETEKKKKRIQIASGTTVFLAGIITSFLLRKKK
jgi:hypothetical protein